LSEAETALYYKTYAVYPNTVTYNSKHNIGKNTLDIHLFHAVSNKLPIMHRQRKKTLSEATTIQLATEIKETSR